MNEKKPNQTKPNPQGNEEQIRNALLVTLEALQSMGEYIHGIVQDFRTNNEKEANAKLSELIEIVNLFVQLISQVKEQHPNINSVMDEIAHAERHLLETVKEILEVKQNADDTSLCDLLEYELGDNLETWQKKIVEPLLS